MQGNGPLSAAGHMPGIDHSQMTLFDPYPLVRPLLFRLDPETAHGIVIKLLKCGLGPKLATADDPILHTKVCGLDFSNPVGLAPGFDKHCEVIAAILRFGFGFTELGGVVPLPQPGNPRPRLFRVTEAKAAINRFDFNSPGFEVAAKRVAAWHSSKKKVGDIVGVNIAKGNHYTDAAQAYILGLKTFAPYLDFVTVNVSCPNTPGLRNLEGREQLAGLLKPVMAAWQTLPKKPRVFVKIAPDQTEQQQEDIAEVVLESGVHGLIIGNTSTMRPSGIPPELAKERGGLSGKPLFAPSTHTLAQMYRLTKGKIPLIGTGGISSGADAYAKILAGAALVQLYTALIFEGPFLVPRLKRDLAALLKRDGFKSVSEAVGSGNR